ncbi:MAG: malto-oligosyltrehalose trehalohydrolase [Solidesulfovibrio sp.]
MEYENFPPGLRPLPPIGHFKTNAGSYRFCVWAPLAKTLELELVAPRAGLLAMEPLENGYWQVEVPELTPGTLYRFRLDGNRSRPDPASHHQPQDVHGPSALADHESYAWSDAGFIPPTLSELILYEIHIGTFTPEGTFQAAEERLAELADLGVTAVQVMPVGQFPGNRNWGYDGVYPFSVHHAYGGPEGLKRFVDACHAQGLAVILDVVYNHLGPEGNYIRDFGPYFTDRYKTPWGEAVNFDGPQSDHVRHYFFQNILHWLTRYHVDGFRLDATHAIHDERPRPFLRELADLTRAYGAAHGKRPLLLAENDRNDPRLAMPPRSGGMGLSGIYNEDFHHSVHAWLTGERQDYYLDYGRMAHLAGTLRRGFAYTGQYSPYQQRSQGEDPKRLPGEALVAFLQNHDQTGNRAHGERLATLVGFEALKAAAGLLLLAPFTPMLFMGEEYGEERPFLYFISHGDPELIQAVRAGRLAEFAGSHQNAPPPPDPQDEMTFTRSKLDWKKRTTGNHGRLVAWHRELIRQRESGLGLAGKKRPKVLLASETGLLVLEGNFGPIRRLYCFNLSHMDQVLNFGGQAPNLRPRANGPNRVETPLVSGPGGTGTWEKTLDSTEERFGGPGSTMPRVLRNGASLSGWSMTIYTLEEARS